MLEVPLSTDCFRLCMMTCVGKGQKKSIQPRDNHTWDDCNTRPPHPSNIRNKLSDHREVTQQSVHINRDCGPVVLRVEQGDGGLSDVETKGRGGDEGIQR